MEASEERQGQDRIVVLGRIAGVFGVKGWVKVQSFTDPPDNLLDYKVWQIGLRGTWSPRPHVEGRLTNRGVLARMENCVDPDQARALVGAEIGVWRSELPPPAKGEYYWEDLTGLDAYSPGGQWLGKVDHFRETAVHPLIVIQGEREHMIPLVKERLLAVDLEARRLTLDWDPDW